ncbi:hypothetical protein [Alicyclobacillus sendaiensis]|uniref:hypothetical protein n=1 Tax=Alicyclobacillus sendaiensis TaxID=192387 RepID=UPI0026F43B12|nr:hypothetical protein [Alicyclobacillus sendaiensis]
MNKRILGMAITVMMTAAVVAGCGEVSLTHKDGSKVSDRLMTSEEKLYPSKFDSDYWIKPMNNRIFVTITSVDKNGMVVIQQRDSLHPYKTGLRLAMSPQTRIWYNGALGRYDVASILKPGDEALVLVGKHNDSLVADTIYGPISQISGIISASNAENHSVEVKEVTYLPKSKLEFTGKNFVLYYNTKTNFTGASPFDLKNGYLLQAQVAGKGDKLFAFSLSVLRRGKEVSPGGYQWIQVG